MVLRGRRRDLRSLMSDVSPALASSIKDSGPRRRWIYLLIPLTSTLTLDIFTDIVLG